MLGENMKELKNNIQLVERPLGTSYEEWDTLGYYEGYKCYLNIFRNLQTSITVGLYGSWGTGKTEIIRALKEDLEKANYLPFIFDAWKYRHEKNIIVPLLHCLNKEYPMPRRKISASVKKISAAVLLSSADIGLRIATKGSAGLSDVKTSLKAAEKNTAEYVKFVSVIDNIGVEFNNLTKELVTSYEKEKLIIFIDNLDRCLPDIVVDLLEDISTYFIAQLDVPCIFVLAMDKENVVKAIQHKYPDFCGAHYLEKIVQLPLQMPVPTMTKNSNSSSIYHFMKRYEWARGHQKNSSQGDKRDKIYKLLTENVSGLFKLPFLNNPRRIERMVHRFVALELMGNFSIEENFENVHIALFLLILKEHFPVVYNSFKTEDDFLDLLNKISWSSMEQEKPHIVKQKYDKQHSSVSIPNMILFRYYIENNDFYDFLKASIKLKEPKSPVKKMFKIYTDLQLIG